MALLSGIIGAGSAIAKAIQNNSKPSSTTSSSTSKGSVGYTAPSSSASNSSGGSASSGSTSAESADYSAIIYDPNASYEAKLKAYHDRYAKEQQMRNAGTWDNSWIPTEQILGVVNNAGAPQTINPYQDGFEQFQQMQQANNAQAAQYYKQYVQQGTDRLNAQRGDINSSYDDAARQAYIGYMQGQKAMPGQMAALGMTGGASESSLMQAQAGYQNNLNSVSTARNKAMNDINTAITDLQNSGDLQTAQYILNNADKVSEAYMSALNADIGRRDSLSQQAQQNAYNTALLTGMYNGNKTLDAQQITYNQQQDAYNRALELAMYSGDFSSLKQFGVSDDVVSAAYQEYLRQRTKTKGGGSGSGSLLPVDYGDDEPEGTNPAPASQGVYNKVRDTALALFSAGTPSAQVAAYLDSFEGQLSDDERWQIMQQLNLYGARGG